MELTSTEPLYWGLGALALIFLIVYLSALLRAVNWSQDEEAYPRLPPLKGLGLPEGSIRGLIALLVIGSFIIFLFFGKPVVSTVTLEPMILNGAVVLDLSNPDAPIPIMTTKTDTTLYTTVITAFGTLTGAIAGFYFGGRSAEPRKLEGAAEPKREKPQPREPDEPDKNQPDPGVSPQPGGELPAPPPPEGPPQPGGAPQ